MRPATTFDIRVGIRLLSILAGSSILLTGVARADEIRLKTGIVLKGRVLAEEKKAIAYERFGERQILDKKLIAIAGSPSPNWALAAGTLIPGGGQLYLGDARGAQILAIISALLGLSGYGLVRLAGQPETTSTVAALVFAYVPGLIGSMRAYAQAGQEASKPKLDIHLDDGAPRHGVGELLAPVEEEE